jgi:ADP-ribosylglycohydrolase
MKKTFLVLLSVVLVVLLVSCATTTPVEEVPAEKAAVKEAESAPGPVKAEPVEEIKKTFPADLSRKDRAMGAIVGALIGDALGVGCHWYYDLECLKKDFGWVTDYVDPKLDSKCLGWPDVPKQRVKAGLKKGGPSQTGQFIIMLLESVAKNAKYVQKDYTARLDELFKTIDGTPYSGRYTDWAIRDTYDARVKKGMSWDDPNIGSLAATSEGAQRAVVLAARYQDDPVDAAKAMYSCIRLTYRDDFVVGQQLAFGMVVNALIEGVQLTEMERYLGTLYGNKEIRPKMIQAYDTIGQVGIGQSAWDPDFRKFPPHMISVLYGMDCEQDHLLPGAYWIVHRFPDDFEKGILTAINGGGNNMARAVLVGAMLGAMNGLSGIPERFINGLQDHERILELVEIVCKKYAHDL